MEAANFCAAMDTLIDQEVVLVKDHKKTIYVSLEIPFNSRNKIKLKGLGKCCILNRWSPTQVVFKHTWCQVKTAHVLTLRLLV